MNEDVGPAYWRRLWRWENYHILLQDPKRKAITWQPGCDCFFCYKL